MAQAVRASLQRYVCPALPVRSVPPIIALGPSPYDPRVQLVTWHSPVLGVTKQLHLYLPPGYTGSQERYPVLYLLRGHEREWVNRAEDASRRGRNVIDIYERLLSSGQVGPMILVMPSLTSDDGSVHGAGIDPLAPWLGREAAGIGTGRWETYLVHDVIPLVDAHWRTLRRGRHRGLDGFSLGGAVAAKLAAKFPERFGSSGAYDGSFFLPSADGREVCASDTLLRHSIFEPAFGSHGNLTHATANSAVSLVARGAPARLGQITWLVQYGPEQREPGGSNFYRGVALVNALQRRGISNALGDGCVVDGEHTWSMADQHLATTLPLHWQALRAAA